MEYLQNNHNKHREESKERFLKFNEQQIRYYDKNPVVQGLLKLYSDYIVFGKGSAFVVYTIIESLATKESVWSYISEMTYRKMENKQSSEE